MYRANHCVVHYNDIDCEDDLTSINLETFNTLINCKKIREDVGGINHHSEQCTNILSDYDERLKYHRRCYQKFTNVKHITKRKSEKTNDESSTRKSSRLLYSALPASESTNSPMNDDRDKEEVRREMFPKYCMICKKTIIKVSGKKQIPSVILTTNAETTMKEAAKVRNDVSMLTAIGDKSLIAKEFKKHKKCYRDYTRVVFHGDNEKGNDSIYEKGNYDLVCEMVDFEIIQNHKCLSMDALLELYGIGNEYKSQYQYKLRQRLKNTYGDMLLFLNPEYHTSQVVISRDCLTSNILSKNVDFSDEYYVNKAAKIIQKAVLSKITDAAELPWPPTVKSLRRECRSHPEILQKFYQSMLATDDNNNKTSERVNRLVDSFCSDVMYALSKGAFLTLKHASIGLGLHSATGQKLPITLLHRIGHCISYDQVNLIETAQAELVQNFSLELPLQPANKESKVTTLFWWDNFDRNIETSSGGGSIHNTPGVVFQEVSLDSIFINRDISIPKSNRRSIVLSEENYNPQLTVNSKTNPGLFIGPLHQNDNELRNCSTFIHLWKLIRSLSQGDYIQPRFAGWLTTHFQIPQSTATVLTYLPPIPKPITEYGTIIEMFHKSRELRLQSNMKYCHITLDIGAAMKAYQVVWNNPHIWADIIIHPGDFHAMMAFFGVIGNYVTGSGFEEMVFELDLCSSGSINGVISGKQYNRCWFIHEAFSEAMSRLFFEQFITTSIPEVLQRIGDGSDESIVDILQEDDAQTFFVKVNDSIVKALNGEFGKTTQYWMKYVQLIDRQYALHYAIKTNNFNIRLSIWDTWMALCFATNRVHYARYGSYYVNFLKNISNSHPGAKEEIEKRGISVRRNNLGIGQAIDLAGEQTYMKSAKTAGGITRFANRPETITKWVMNRPFQSEFNEALQDYCNLSKSMNNIKKCLRPSEIKKSNNLVTKIMNALCNQFINPFDPSLEKCELYNLASGFPVKEHIRESLLTLEEQGKSIKEEFDKRMEANSDVDADFYSPIKRNKYASFDDSTVKTVLKKNGRQRELSCQREILGLLVCSSYQSKKAVDIEKAMTYPLAPVSLPLCTPDGVIRKTVKSKLVDAAMSDLNIVNIQDLPSPNHLNTYFLDVIAFIRSSTCINGSIRNLAWKMINSVPNQYTKIFLVCDTYRETSIKSGEREKRGQGKRYVIKSPDMKIPFDFVGFMRNGLNKTMLLNLIEQSLIEGNDRFGPRTLYFSNANHCTLITRTEVRVVPELASDHEEADTKLVALFYNIDLPACQSVMVRSPSGDVDILVLFLLHQRDGIRVLIDNGTGKSRKILDMSSSGLNFTERQALAGLHAFSGNDYVSSFFRKGKQVFWNKLKKSEEFTNIFAALGSVNSIDDEIYKDLERIVCHIYGYQHFNSVDTVRKEMVMRYYEKSGKTVELSILPPCSSNLYLHAIRSNYVANIYKSANQMNMCLDDPALHGWNGACEPKWTEEKYPDDLTALLFDDEHIVNDINDDLVEYDSTSDNDSSYSDGE